MIAQRVAGSLSAVVSLAIVLAGCESVTDPPDEKATWKQVTLDERVTDAYTGFGFQLFRHLRAEDPKANLFASPTSAAIALALTYNGAAGQTQTEMAQTLGVGDVDLETLNETNRAWLAALQNTGDPQAELDLANSVWYRSDRPVLESFRDQVRAHYAAEVLPISTAAAINQWVEEATRGRIDEIIEGEIPGDVVAYLINALYFKADWTFQFDEADTREAQFHLLDGSTVTVPMMWQDFALDDPDQEGIPGPEFRADDQMEMLRLFYGSGRFSMVLALPREGHDLGTIAQRLEPDRWKDWMDQFTKMDRLRLGMPRFQVEWEDSLKNSLQAMGMEAPFVPGVADFSRMFDGGGPWIDQVLQKTFLKVDEQGTEAAAVTKVVMRESAPPEIVLDRPFFLAIYDHATETVLFLGQITDPGG